MVTAHTTITTEKILLKAEKKPKKKEEEEEEQTTTNANERNDKIVASIFSVLIVHVVVSRSYKYAFAFVSLVVYVRVCIVTGE